MVETFEVLRLTEIDWMGSLLLTHCTGEFACSLLQQPDYLRLLSRGASAANHSGTLTGKLHELILVIFQTNLPKEEKKSGQVSTSSHHI